GEGKSRRGADPNVGDAVGFGITAGPEPSGKIIVHPAIVLRISRVIRAGQGHGPAIGHPSGPVPTCPGKTVRVDKGDGFFRGVGSALVRPIKMPARLAQAPFADILTVRGVDGGRSPEMLTTPEMERGGSTVVQKSDGSHYSHP